MTALNQQIKDLIALIPIKERDKLLTRLLKKDLNLVNKLLFEYIKEESVDQRREKVQNEIEKKIAGWGRVFASSPDDLLLQMRTLSGLINEHVYITKDKFGEVALNILMIRQIIDFHFETLNKTNSYEMHKFNDYLIARLLRTLVQIKNLHEDLHLEFKKDLQQIAEKLNQLHHFKQVATNKHIDLNWLDIYNIPDNIDTIQKNSRKRDFYWVGSS